MIADLARVQNGDVDLSATVIFLTYFHIFSTAELRCGKS
jgi:hypothetical protein